jgi:hypothetical protein
MEYCCWDKPKASSAIQNRVLNALLDSMLKSVPQLIASPSGYAAKTFWKIDHFFANPVCWKIHMDQKGFALYHQDVGEALLYKGGFCMAR